MTKIVEVEERIRLLEYERETAREELAGQIVAEVTGPMRGLLIYRCVECLSWSQVAHHMKQKRAAVYEQFKNFSEGLA